jgi:hydrogenase expression/formation protein HypD
MKWIDEFRDKDVVKALVREIWAESKKPIRLMEVCGGHTMSIHRFGIQQLIPPTIELLSGPGCPVCVTDQSYIDHAVALARHPDVILTTFGDLIRVPGSSSTLERERAAGADVRVLLSPAEAVDIAKDNPSKKIVFLGIGFETTAPTIAASLVQADSEHVLNYYVLSAHKVMPPAMRAIIHEGIGVNGYICPGHVSAITGTSIYEEFPLKFGVSAVVSGFEPTDLLQSILMSVGQLETNSPKVEIQYSRIVNPVGNLIAQKVMSTVFDPVDAYWRGVGVIPLSGLGLNKAFSQHDAALNINVDIEPLKVFKGCICGEILKGLKRPIDCPLFRKGCSKENPVGACMVSNEGACAAYYLYGN